MQIVVTHGRAQQFRIPRTLARDWEDALRRGLERARYDRFDSVPVEFVFYGDIWRPDHEPEPERGDDLLDELTDEPTALEAEVARDLLAQAEDAERFPFDALGRVVRGLDEALGVGSLLLAWFLKDLNEYFERPAIRSQVLATVRTALQSIDDDVVLLGHSMGSIVGYDYLASRRPRDPGVRALVTFGSPLGLPSVLKRVTKLNPGAPFPPALDRWVNVYNEKDFATLVRRLAPIFLADGRERVDDVAAKGRDPSLRDPASAHDAIVYLSSMALGRGLRDVLESFDLGRRVSRNGGGGGGVDAADPGRAEEPERTMGRAPGAGDRTAARPTERRMSGGGLVGGAAPRRMAHAPPRPSAPIAHGAVIGGVSTFDGQRRAGPVFADRGFADVSDQAVGDAPSIAVPTSPAPGGPVFELGEADEADVEPEAAEPAAPGGTKTVERTASADFPPVVAPGSEHVLLVAVAGHAVFARSTPTTLVVPQEAKQVTLKVGVYAPDFTILDEAGTERAWTELEIDLVRTDAVSKGRFVLRASATKKRIDSTIYLTFYHRSLPVGQLSLVTAIDPRHEVRSSPINVSFASAPDPDYVLIVTDTSRNGTGRGPFDIRVSREGEYLDRPLGRFPVTQNAWKYARQILQRFRAARRLRRAEDRRREAENLGLDLWWALPPEFRDFYWKELHGKDCSIAIYSQEPYIPWELIKPQRTHAGRTGPFLGQSFSIARWKQARTFPDPLTVTGFSVIAPEYRLDPLPAAQDEANDLVGRFGATRVPGRAADVRRLLRSTGVQLVHFAGHGQYDPDRSEESVIKLADGPLVPRDLYRAKLGRTSRPLVFLNACEVGERGWTLTQIGGWAEAFCDVGFSGFVGPYWAVSDKVGRKAANLFYDELTRGATVGAAMRTIRRQFDDDDEFPAHPSWLAYTLHCQPNVRVELPQ